MHRDEGHGVVDWLKLAPQLHCPKDTLRNVHATFVQANVIDEWIYSGKESRRRTEYYS
jgi:hypothetical protein